MGRGLVIGETEREARLSDADPDSERTGSASDCCDVGDIGVAGASEGDVAGEGRGEERKRAVR